MGTGRTLISILICLSCTICDQVADDELRLRGPLEQENRLWPLSITRRETRKNDGSGRFNGLAVQSGWSTTLSNANGPPILRLLVEASCASKPWTLPTRRPERNDVLYNDIVSIQSKSRL